ncbi:MAG: TonB-dependent receptor [Mangrovibacterium sp.]
MKLTTFLLLISFFGVLANKSHSQTLSLDLKNATLKEALSKIEDRCGCNFLYSEKFIDVQRKISISIENKKLEDALKLLFSDTGVKFERKERIIILSPRTEPGSQQQSLTVSGYVTDFSGSPLPGVTIIVKSTTVGTITDSNGNYSLPNVSGNAVLIFSFVGMKTQEIPVSGKANINVTLEEESVGLEEVVAIGYGTARKKDLAGSVVSVSGATLKDIPVTSAAAAIAGRMAGVQVTKTEGSPDAEIKIRVRGGGSLTQDNSPLYIVDGFPVDNINGIAPTDISSIDVLKDASSTAIYGARGANGVIIITTKGGSEGKSVVSYNSYMGVKKITKTLKVMSPSEYVYWQYELRPNNSTDSQLERYYGDIRDLDLYDQVKGTNWQDEVFGRTGTSQYHNLAVSGGTKIFKYNISLTRNEEKEIMLGSNFSRTNLTVKTFNKVNNWLSLDLNIRLSDDYIKGAGTSANNRLMHAVMYSPVNGLMDYVDTEIVSGVDYEAINANNNNPVKQTNDDYRRTKMLTFNFNGAATINFTKDLNYRIEYGSQYGETSNKRFYGINTSNVIQYGTMPMASISQFDGKSYRLANILTYTKKNFITNHNLNIMVGEELNNYKSVSSYLSSKYFPKYIDAASALGMMQLGTPDPNSTSDNPATRVSSFFGRLNYDYKGRYIVAMTFRADGSSKFAPGNQWGYFPSAALAWRASDEHFMKETTKWLSDLKLRASYGEAGNNRISDNAWKKTFSVATGGFFDEGNETTYTTFLMPNNILSNPKLKWETTVTRNIGLDFGFFRQRLSGSVETYLNTTEDLLLKANIPSSTGYSVQWQNIGQTSNRGIEIVLNAEIVEKKDFRLSAQFNIGFNKNKIDKLGTTKSWEQTSMWVGSTGIGTVTGDYFIKEGDPIGQMYGYETEGMYSFDDFNYANGAYTLKENVSDNSGLIAGAKFMPGALKLKDQNGDFKVDAANDRVIVGDANPKHTGGFNLVGQYKGFDASAFFNWVYGNDIYNANKIYFSRSGGSNAFRNLLDIMNSKNRFTYVNRTTGTLVYNPAELAEMNKDAKIWSSAMDNMVLHSWAVEDGSFLRLNNVTIGYTLPKSLIKKYRIQKIRVYATAYNLWTWTKYSGYDPEVDTQRSTPLTPGIDWCAYPRSRSFNAGLNIEF